jgi:taurine dioxygenase
MAPRFQPSGKGVGVFVSGIDFGNVSKGDASSLYQAFLEYGVLIFKGMKLNVPEHIKLAGFFGQMSDPHNLEELRLPEEPRITILAANEGKPVAANDPDADKIIGQIPWHSDGMYRPSPNRGALLRAVVIPEKGGNTGWIDSARVYRTLPYGIKAKIQDLRIIHSYDVAHRGQSMVKGGAGMFPEVIHPLVSVHPENDLPVLNLSPSTAKEIVGLPEEEATELLDYLVRFGTNEEEAYVHDWEPGDIVAWDNLRTMHRAFGHLKRYPRVMNSLALKAEMRLGRYVKDEDLRVAA